MSFIQIATNNARPRLYFGSFARLNAKMSSKASTPSHYETLEVHNRATQSEIKSAYFKLSKKYHPDRNSSDAATAKFRDVTEAYEVLGSYASRKMYDRSILTRTQYRSVQQAEKSVDPKIKYYQSQAAVFRDSRKSGSVPLYDFDAWTKAHYGRTFNRTMKEKAESTKIRESRTITRDTSKDTTESIFIYLILVSIALWLLGIPKPSYSDPAFSVSQRSGTFEDKSTKMSSQRSDT